jgi:branched-chain amino acid transport system permease protein
MKRAPFWAILRFTLLGAILLGAPFLPGTYLLSLATRAAILACAAVALQFVVGYAGLYSFGHAAYLGIGAYSLLALGTIGEDDAAVSLPAAIGACALFAAGTGWLALRTRGVAFIMITLAFGQMAFFVAQSLAVFGGDDGMALDRKPPVFGHDILDDRLLWYGLVTAMLLAFILLSHMLRLSRFGRALRAARESEARATASGFNVTATFLAAYIISGAATGAAGWLLAVQSAFISPAMLDWRNAGELLVMVILGGGATAEGAALGALLLVLAQELLAAETEHWRLILGPILVLIALRKSIGFARR